MNLFFKNGPEHNYIKHFQVKFLQEQQFTPSYQ